MSPSLIPPHQMLALATSNASSPTYTAPTQFNIGFGRTQEPLVNISQVKGHLALLHAFTKLRKQVERLQVRKSIPQMLADLERRWAWFVALAVERFDIWCRQLRSSDAENDLEVTLPPLDVIMVLHAYMLSPMYWSVEDCMRLPACQVLKDVGICLANALLQSILSTPPSQARVDFWFAKMALPFDHVESVHKLINNIIHCLQCGASIDVGMMTPQGSGYLPPKFSTSCSHGCSMPEITKGTLVLRKMAQDLATPGDFSLAGTLLNPSIYTFTVWSTVGSVIKRHILSNAQVFTPSSQSAHCVACVSRNSPCLGRLCLFRATRIMGAYHNDKAYSVELVGAVLRQELYVKKMYCPGWTGPRFFDRVGNELVLQHAISRYHAFLPGSYGFIPHLILCSNIGHRPHLVHTSTHAC
ncbi:hypothetical protein BYT27DRAFT_7270509 [Phlegmacium glaucopus]|nr:hypothetical protein BYT27DRAFT_7270509 [Phlegmacium glaucopus]